jgi:hypothetical protein
VGAVKVYVIGLPHRVYSPLLGVIKLLFTIGNSEDKRLPLTILHHKWRNDYVVHDRLQWVRSPMDIPRAIPSDLLSRKERDIHAGTKQTVTFRELAERPIITKGLNGAAAWLRAKVGVFPIDVRIEQRDDVYEMLVRVTYRPLPPMPEVVYERQEP